jgi:mycofactocin precursor
MTEQAVLEQAVSDEKAQVTGAAPEDEALIADELLVEEVSIDGMCGVY